MYRGVWVRGTSCWLILLLSRKEMAVTHLITIFTLLALTHALHLQRHAQSASALLPTRQTLVDAAKQMREAAAKDAQNLEQTADIDAKIAAVEQALARQRLQLLEMVRKAQERLNSSSWTCPQLAGADRAALLASSPFLLSSLSAIADQLPLKSTPSLKESTAATGEAVNAVPILAAAGKQVTPSDYHVSNWSNINMGNWISVSPDGAENVAALSAAPMHLCPTETPYYDGQKCIGCPQDQGWPYYEMQSGRCVNCLHYSQQTHTCLGGLIQNLSSNWEAGRDRLLIPQGTTFEQLVMIPRTAEKCPDKTPFYNGSICIACAAPLLFSSADNLCLTCPEGKYFALGDHSCVTQLYFSNLDGLAWQTNTKSLDDVVESISIARSSPNYAECPKETPYSTQGKCISCTAPQHFSYDTLTCSSCPNGTALDLSMHRCLTPGNLNFQTNPANTSGLIFNGRSINQWANKYYQNLQDYAGISDCPTATPFFDGLACISCPYSHPYFNLETLVCQSCPGNTLYDIELRECVTNDEDRAVQKPTWEKMAAGVFA